MAPPALRSNPGSSTELRELALYAAVLLAGIALYWVHVVPGAIAAHPRGVTHSDFYSYFLPKFVYGTRAVLAGEIPLWNPTEYLGLPFLGTAQPAVFYPPKLLLFGALEPVPAYWAFLVLHALAMAAGALLFLRSQGLGAAAAFAGAIVWCFSQSTLLSMYHPVRVACLVWTPLVFWLAHRLQGGFRAGPFAGLALVVAVQLLGGYPEFSLDLSLMLFVYAVAQWGRGEWRAPWRTLPILAGAFVLAALLAAPQLLPLLEVVMDTQRVELARRFEFSFGGSQGTLVFATLQAFPAMAVFLLLGAIERRARSAAILYGFVLALTVGGWEALRWIPGFSIARSGITWALFLPFLAAWVSAFGVDRVLRRLDRGEAHRTRWGLGLGMFGLMGFAAWHGLADGPEIRWSLEAFGPETLGAGLSLATGLWFLAFAARRRGLPTWAVGGGLSLAMAAQMLAFPFWNPPLPIQLHPDPLAMAERATTQPPGRSLSLDNLQYGHTVLHGVESLFGMEISMMPWRYRTLVSQFDVNLLMSTIDWAGLAQARGFLDATDVRYLVASRWVGGTLRAEGLRRVDEGPGRMAVFENPDRMGRAWVSYGARVVESAAAARETVTSPAFDPRRQVVLERAPARIYPELASDAPTPARVERPASDRLRIHVTLPRPGILVVSEAGAPGWRARVDGAPRAWLQANYLLRAVELDAGEHVVEFQYRPRTWSAALSACAIGSLTLAVLFGVAARDRMRSRALRDQPDAESRGGRTRP